MMQIDWGFNGGMLLENPERYGNFFVIATVPFPLGGHVRVVRSEDVSRGWKNPGGGPSILGPLGGDILGKAKNAFGYGDKGNYAFMPDPIALKAAIVYFNSIVKPADAVIIDFEEVDGELDPESFATVLKNRKYAIAKSGAFFFHDVWYHAPSIFYLPCAIWESIFTAIRFEMELVEQLGTQGKAKEIGEPNVVRVAEDIDVVTARLTSTIGLKITSREHRRHAAGDLADLCGKSNQERFGNYCRIGRNSWKIVQYMGTHRGDEGFAKGCAEAQNVDEVFNSIQKRVLLLEDKMPCCEANAWSNQVITWITAIDRPLTSKKVPSIKSQELSSEVQIQETASIIERLKSLLNFAV